MFLAKKQRREIIQLNVIPLIDISSMIIIFLIMGTIFGESSISLPKNLFLPKSESKDLVTNALQVVITNNEVDTKFLNLKLPITTFYTGEKQKESNIKELLKDYVKKLPAQSKDGSLLLNVVADWQVNYKTIYDVVKVFRESGFESVLFVTVGENIGK